VGGLSLPPSPHPDPSLPRKPIQNKHEGAFSFNGLTVHIRACAFSFPRSSCRVIRFLSSGTYLPPSQPIFTLSKVPVAPRHLDLGIVPNCSSPLVSQSVGRSVSCISSLAIPCPQFTPLILFFRIPLRGSIYRRRHNLPSVFLTSVRCIQ
jgi:hypothetical protein